MKPILFALPLVLFAHGLAGAQTIPELNIGIEGFKLMDSGPEKFAGVSRSTGDIRIGVPVSTVFSMGGCGYFTVQPGPNPFPDGAEVGWRLDMTALRVAHHAVTFRLRWVRALDQRQTQASPSTPPGDEIELTLQPGESRPIDTVPVSPKNTTSGGRQCDVKSASLRVAVNFAYEHALTVGPNLDRRLIGVDVWLVERLPNGKEDSQLQAVRGQPHAAISFFFDSLPGGRARVDIFGHLIADLDHGDIAVELQTVKSLARPSQSSGYQAARWFRSAITVKPDETVEVAMPGLSEADGGLDGRSFSLRIRVKQLR